MRITGKWLTRELVFLVRPLNGTKEMVVYGKCTPEFKLKLVEFGFVWDRERRCWARIVNKLQKLPSFVKE